MPTMTKQARKTVVKPSTEQYLEQDMRYGAQNYAPMPVVLCKGRGVFVWDVQGKRYFDMLSAYSAVNQGHNHPRIIAAAKAQMDRLCLTSRAFYNDVMGDYLEKLCKVTGMEKVLLMNSGAEGVEGALKAMRRWGYEVKGVEKNKAEIIVCKDNFHGRTTTIISFSTDFDSYDGFGPLTPGFEFVPYGDAAALEKAVTKNTVGFLVEPIQGEAGVKIPPKGYLKSVRKICSTRRVLLCTDEIQTGLGRTGKMFCFEHEGVRPDVLIIGKAMSGGVYPISAVATSTEVMNSFKAGNHGSTYGGNALASAIGMAALDVLIDEKLVDNARRMGAYFRSRLDTLQHPKLRAVRSAGLLLAVEFADDLAYPLSKKLRENGMLAKPTGAKIVRFAPPLSITEKQVDEAFEIIRSAVEGL